MDDITRNRKQTLLQGVNMNSYGLEIGPSFRPIAPKKEGYKVKVIDYTSEKVLRKKYGEHGIDISEIEEVDYIWNGENFKDLMGRCVFDWILASHVLEHVPDLISFLKNCEDVLKPGGIINLAIPDKNYCFDHNRQYSALSRIIDIHESKCKIQTVGAAAEYFLTVCKKNGIIAWDSKTVGKLENVHTLEDALHAISQTREGVYLDIHNWVFEPNSFNDIIQKLKLLKYINLEIKEISATVGHEFFVTLFKK
jgi:2-polyprenyl-3-methyl-5-hydroxy-6-metoxy-1,4-benzoquinol methylase